MIAISAVVAAVEAIRRLVDPVPLAHLGWVAAAGVIGFIGNEVVALYRIRVGKRIGSAALRADGMHARADGLTSLAVVAGAIGAALGFPLADPIIGLRHRGRHRCRAGRRRARRVRQAVRRVDPELVDGAVTVLADPTGSPRGSTGQDALGRPPTGGRRRTRRRSITEPGRRAQGCPRTPNMNSPMRFRSSAR